MDQIMKIFNSEDEKEIKQAFKDIIIKQFKNDLEDSGEYFFDRSMVEELITEMFTEVVEEVKGEVKDMIRDNVLKSIDADMLQKIMKKVFK